MTSNSYPLSFSATTSPQSDSDALPPVMTNLTTESSSRDHPETQITLQLQQASIALEAARRMRHFRRSLRDSATSGEHRRRPSEAAYSSPDNDLSTLESFSVRDSSSPDSYVPSLSQLPAVRPLSTSGRRLNRDLPPLSTAVPARDTLSSLSSPSASQTPYTHLARSQLESRFQRHRDSSVDDASTTLGRRVAAREAARASTVNLGSRTLNPMSRFEGNFVQLIATMEQEFEHLRQQRSELSRTHSPDTRAAPLSRRTVELRRQHATQSREANPPANSSLVPQSDLLRRRLTGSVFPSRSSTMSSRSERLSLLSNFSSVQNLPTPVSSSSRLLLFEEPTSYPQAPYVSSEGRRDTWSTEYDTESDRSYVVRRRLNADGEEHVHPINLEWLHEPLVHVGQGIRRVAQPGQSEVGSQRRRGWARLDPDGNEIPFEQEAELERTMSEYRLQAQSSPAQTDSGFHSLQAPTTSTSLTPDDDDDGMPQVRLNNLGSREYHTSIMDNVGLKAVEKVPASFVEPFRPNPLPTPLEHMIWTPPSRQRIKRVSKHANFAGR